MKRLENKVAIVTGAGTGIGRAISVGYAREGADVVIVYSSSEAGALETKRLVEEQGRKGLPVQCDLADPEAITRMVQTAYDAFGHIDILVNNAAARDVALLFDFSEELWDHGIAVNLRALFLTIKAVAPHMIRQGDGHIINICSQMGKRASSKARLCYASAKTGAETLTLAAAAELGQYGIHVNSISPGSIDTNMGGLGKTITSDIVKRREEVIPLHRRGVPDDLAGPAIFLACSESDYVDAVSLDVGGGYVTID